MKMEDIYKKDKEGNIMFSAQGKKIIDHDLDQIAEDFGKFRGKEKINF